MDELKKLVSAESASNAFGHVPRFYLEIAHMFIRYAKEDLPDSDMVRSFILIRINVKHLLKIEIEHIT